MDPLFGLLFVVAVFRYFPEAIADIRGTRTGKHERRMATLGQRHEKEMERLRQDKPLLADTLHQRWAQREPRPSKPKPTFEEMGGFRRFVAAWGADAGDWATVKRRGAARKGGEWGAAFGDRIRRARGRAERYPVDPTGDVVDPPDADTPTNGGTTAGGGQTSTGPASDGSTPASAGSSTADTEQGSQRPSGKRPPPPRGGGGGDGGAARRRHEADQRERDRAHEAEQAAAQREHEQWLAAASAAQHAQQNGGDPSSTGESGPVSATATRADQEREPAALEQAPIGADGQPVEDAEVVTDDEEESLASVTPITRTQSTQEATDMSAPAEGGLSASIGYAEQQIDSIDGNIPGLETTAASLETHDWSGDAVEGFREAMEHFQAARAAIARSKTALETEGLAVKDAYSGSGVGSKESVLQD